MSSIGTSYRDFRASLNLTPEQEDAIRLEKELLLAVSQAREEKGLTQRELADTCGLTQPVIARLENPYTRRR